MCRFQYYPGHAGFPNVLIKIMKSKILKWSKIQGYGRHSKNEGLEFEKNLGKILIEINF